jgi:hypothetical protein
MRDLSFPQHSSTSVRSRLELHAADYFSYLKTRCVPVNTAEWV